MKTLKALICVLAFTLPLLFMVFYGPPAEAEKAQKVSGKEVGEVNQEQVLQEVTTNSVGMVLKLIPAGRFMMGAVKGDDEAEDCEKPRHRVKITRPFYIGVYEVTQAQYEAVMGNNPSQFKGAKRPVESVIWDEAMKFCRRLSKREGVTYRLPTEAEWEYACRAGTNTRYYWGDNMDGSYAWYRDNSGEKTNKVGQKLPNAWGLYDMSGNVSEWCSDWYGEDYYGSSPKRDPQGPESGDGLVLRGGCWYYKAAWLLRSSTRFWVWPDYRNCIIGFRVVREVE